MAVAPRKNEAMSSTKNTHASHKVCSHNNDLDSSVLLVSEEQLIAIDEALKKPLSKKQKEGLRKLMTAKSPW